MKNMQKYRKLGFKLTPQRIAILDYLEGNKTHPSAEDIYKAVSDRFPTMSFATVYNTMEALIDKGDVVELNIDTNKKRFDPDCSPHNHLICVKCKNIFDIYQNFSIDITTVQKNGFLIIDNQIAFHGICSQCMKTQVDPINTELIVNKTSNN